MRLRVRDDERVKKVATENSCRTTSRAVAVSEAARSKSKIHGDGESERDFVFAVTKF